ncbi:MAG: hypothetical protein ABJB03_11285 [Rhodoglobus sp.]
MKTIAHTRGSLETADAVADSIGALDDALRENHLVARLEIPVGTAQGAPITIEVMLGKRQVVSTERPPALPVDDAESRAFDFLDLDSL